MADLRHQATVRLFRDNYRLAPYLARVCGAGVVAGTAELADSDLSITDHGLALPGRGDHELRADAISVISGNGQVRQVIICEPQSSGPDSEKRFKWVLYIGAAGVRYRCRVTLLVLALNRETAKSCAVTHVTGHPGFNLTPVISDSGNTPDPDAPGAEDLVLQLAMLGFLNRKYDIAHEPARRYVFSKLACGEPGIRTEYTGIVIRLAVLDKPELEKTLRREMMTTIEYRKTFWDEAIDQSTAKGVAEGITQGVAKGKGDLLLHILDKRGFEITSKHRALVESCTDETQLEAWTDIALTATTIENVFPD